MRLLCYLNETDFHWNKFLAFWLSTIYSENVPVEKKNNNSITFSIKINKKKERKNKKKLKKRLLRNSTSKNNKIVIRNRTTKKNPEEFVESCCSRKFEIESGEDCGRKKPIKWLLICKRKLNHPMKRTTEENKKIIWVGDGESIRK